jgi:hypothetical protein
VQNSPYNAQAVSAKMEELFKAQNFDVNPPDEEENEEAMREDNNEPLHGQMDAASVHTASGHFAPAREPLDKHCKECSEPALGGNY